MVRLKTKERFKIKIELQYYNCNIFNNDVTLSVCVCVCVFARANFKGYGEKALTPEAVAQRSSVKKVFLEIWQNSQKKSVLEFLFLLKKRLWHWQENTCTRVSLFNKTETVAQGFFCEFCKIYKNIFFTEHLWATATRLLQVKQKKKKKNYFP